MTVIEKFLTTEGVAIVQPISFDELVELYEADAIRTYARSLHIQFEEWLAANLASLDIDARIDCSDHLDFIIRTHEDDAFIYPEVRDGRDDRYVFNINEAIDRMIGL